MCKIKISSDFTKAPGPRFIYEGKYSGEEFRENILKPKYMEAKHLGVHLEIDFDGGYGYGTSFLEEAFGGLARNEGIEQVKSILILISSDDVSLPERVTKYIDEANIERKVSKQFKGEQCDEG